MCSARFTSRLRSAVLALDVQKLDGSKRFGPCTYPHVEILSKFEIPGPRNGRGRTSPKPLKCELKHHSSDGRTKATRQMGALKP